MILDRISVFGLGKLGACMAATMAAKGASVVGVDIDARAVAAINDGDAPIIEPGLTELVAEHRARLRGTTDAAAAVRETDLSFVIVPTPSEPDGGFSLRHVEQVVRAIGRALRDKRTYHLVVLTSTVMPGATAGRLLPLLEAESGKRCGPDFGLCYNPEFIALGSVVHDLLHPDFVLIGESDERAGALLEQWYAGYCEGAPPVSRMSIVAAELTKLSVNAFVTMKITFANTIAAMCEALPGADIDVVSAAIGRDSRIGRKYLTGGLGYGGPCFPRDNNALAALASQLGAPADLARATDRANAALLDRQVERVGALLDGDARVAVLGVAYKPCTGVVEESQGLALARRLAERGAAVTIYDSLALETARAALGDVVEFATTVEEALHDADVVIVATPSDEFRELRASDVRSPTRRVLVVDCWRMLAGEFADADGIDYLPLGVGVMTSAVAERVTAARGA